VPAKTDKDGALRCTKCERLMKLGSGFYGWEPPKESGSPDWPVHIWNGWTVCDKAPAPTDKETTNG